MQVADCGQKAGGRVLTTSRGQEVGAGSSSVLGCPKAPSEQTGHHKHLGRDRHPPLQHGCHLLATGSRGGKKPGGPLSWLLGCHRAPGLSA